MKILAFLLIILLLVLQYKLWFGPGGFTDMLHLKHQLASLQKVNDQLQERNTILLADIKALKHGTGAIESRARSDLGMVKKGEIFYQVVS